MTTITVLQNQTIYMLAQTYYGGQEGIFDIARLNGIGVGSELFAGQKLKIDETKKTAIEKRNRKAPAKTPATAYTTTVTDGQSIYNLATQHYGGVDALFTLFKQSSVNFKSALNGGLKLPMDRKNIVNADYAKYFEGSERRINTFKKIPLGDGIGYMGIEFDFIVR